MATEVRFCRAIAVPWDLTIVSMSTNTTQICDKFHLWLDRVHQIVVRNRLTFFVGVGHQTTNMSIGNKHFLKKNSDIVRLTNAQWGK